MGLVGTEPMLSCPKQAGVDPSNFVGRVRELEDLRRAVEERRLVTLVGPAGIGKTRLAQRFIEVRPDLPSVFCDLCGTTTVDGLATQLAECVDSRLDRSDDAGDLVDAVGKRLAARGSVVVVLDNFEQLVPTGLPALHAWLRRAPEATFVVTSRRMLRLRSEWTLEVPALSLPPCASDAEAGAAHADSTSDAVELFVDRARSCEPGFDASDRAALADLARRLEGIPLALELAAAQMRWFSPRALVQNLETSSALELDAHARDSDPRHASLDVALRSSRDQLAPYELAALRQLTVCQGFTLEVAEAVIDLRDFPEVPPVRAIVASLREATLLRSVPRSSPEAPPRWDMYEAIREFFRPEDDQPAASRHAAYFQAEARRWCEPTAPAGPSSVLWNGELKNIRAAFSWSSMQREENPQRTAELALGLFEAQHDARPALVIGSLMQAQEGGALSPSLRCRLLIAVGVTHSQTGDLDEAGRWLIEANGFVGSDPRLRTELNLAEGMLAFCRGHVREARERLRDAVRGAEHEGLARLEMLSRMWLGTVLAQGFQDPFALKEYQRAMQIARTTHDLRGRAKIRTMALLCEVFQRRGDPRAELESLAGDARRRSDGDAEAVTEQILGVLAFDTGDKSAARQHLHRARRICRSGGFRRYASCVAKWHFALEEEDGRPVDLAARRLATVDFFRSIGDERNLGYGLLEICVAIARRDEDVVAALELWHRGMTLGRRCGDAAILALGEIQRARVALVESEWLARQGSVEEASQQRLEALRRVETARAVVGDGSTEGTEAVISGSPEARWALRCFEREIATGAELRRVLWVRNDGGAFRLGGDAEVSLPRGPVTRRALLTLARTHHDAQGAALSRAELVAACWPGEKALEEACAQRVRQVVARLRKLGLASVLVRTDSGYALDSSITVRLGDDSALGG